MLWKIKLPTQERILILLLFSSSILSLMASIAYVVVWAISAHFGSNSRMAIRTVGQIQVTLTKLNNHAMIYIWKYQAAISLLVCNLLVVAMLFYRMAKRERPRHFAAPTSRTIALDTTTRQGVPSEKNNSADRPRSQGYGTDNTWWVERLQVDSILAISFTTVFDSTGSVQGDSSAGSTPSLNKISAGTPSLLFYHQNHSICSSDSRIPRWSFSDCSGDTTSPDP